MNGQLGLVFEPAQPAPRARRRDPSTSHTAAKRVSGVAINHRNVIMAALATPGTIYDIGARCGMSHVQVARRLPELEEMGLAAPTEEKRDGCRVWKRTGT